MPARYICEPSHGSSSDAAIEHEGRHYLPYRLHATREQFYSAYPQSREFFDRKREYDPEELFQNQFYIKYGNPGEVARPGSAKSRPET